MELNITTFDKMKDFFIDAFRGEKLQLILGSGYTVGETARNGIVPSGKTYSQHMIEELKKNETINKELTDEDLNSLRFGELAEYYENDEFVSNKTRETYYTNNFTNASLSEQKKQILEINWPYVYTLNLDDAIERNTQFNHVIYSNRPVKENIFDINKCVIKLHGDINDLISYSDSNCRIFTNKEYIRSIRSNYLLLNRLEHDYNYHNILFVGCSLSDELDLQSISIYPFSDLKEDIHRIVISKEIPTFKQKQNFRKYGITDVIIVSDYNEGYDVLYNFWKESQKEVPENIGKFKNVRVDFLDKTEDNMPYFLFGKSLYSSKTNKISIPYFFTSRVKNDQKYDFTNKTGIVFIQGGAISGKSYFLIDSYLSVNNKNKFIFSGATRLNDVFVDKLLSELNCFCFFDLGSLSRNQFERILINSNKIRDNNSCFIFVIGLNNSDLLGIIKMKLSNKEIPEKNVFKVKINSFFSETELVELNRKLPFVKIPAFDGKKSILDNIVYIQKNNSGMERGKYSKTKILFNKASVTDIELLVLLATKEKIYSYDITKFRLQKEINTFCFKFPQFIDTVYTDLFEMSASDNSTIKYVLNAKYWLHSELASFAANSQNFPLIAEAYISIIRTIRENSPYATEFNDRELYREFTLFDTINNIFSLKYRKNLGFIIKLYDCLYSELATDYQYLHQFAKGYLMESYQVIDESQKKLKLQSAMEKIDIALSIVKQEINNKELKGLKVDNNLITVSHMNFTKSLISCELCLLEDFSDLDFFSTTTDLLYESIMSPYNYSKLQDYDQNKTLTEYINKGEKVSIDASISKKLVDIMNQIYQVNRETF